MRKTFWKIFQIQLPWRRWRCQRNGCRKIPWNFFGSATRGSSDGWKHEGKQRFFLLVEKIKTLREDPVTGSNFEHKLMVKWLSEKTGAVGENMNTVTYSIFEENDKRFKANDIDFLTNTGVYKDILAEYEAVMTEETERERNVKMETYVATEVGGKVTNI